MSAPSKADADVCMTLIEIMDKNRYASTIIEISSTILYNLATNDENCKIMKSNNIDSILGSILIDDKIKVLAKVPVQALVDKITYSIPRFC